MSLYEIVGWGVLNPPDVDADAQDRLAKAGLNLQTLRQSYETEPPWLMVPLAVGDSVLQRRWFLPALPSNTPRVEPYTARIIAPVPSIYIPYADVLWKRAQTAYRTAGLTLPDATLILASDWD